MIAVAGSAFAQMVAQEDKQLDPAWVASLTQRGKKMQANIAVNHGQLSLRTLVLQMPAGARPKKAHVKIAGETIPCKVTNEDGRTLVQLAHDVVLSDGQTLSVSL